MDKLFSYQVLKYLWLCSCFFVFRFSYAQQYENGSLDMGMGAVISVGLQEEPGFDIRLQYTTATNLTSYLVEYNQYFIKEFENTKSFGEFNATFNRRLFAWSPIDVSGGVGYVVNDYRVLATEEDTSNLFFTTGNINHGMVLKLRGLYQVSMPIHIFIEVNMKSFGRRYDTLALGLTYSLGL